MAYDFFPKTSKEIEDKLSKEWPADYVKQAMNLHQMLVSKIDTPINIDIGTKSMINVTRALQGDVDLKSIKSKVGLTTFKLKFGNGSSGNRGANNRGNAFESQFANAIEDWYAGREVTDPKLLRAIEDLNKTYDLAASRKFDAKVVGGENTRRPVQYKGKIELANPKGSGMNVGKSVTDITLENDGDDVYLSLKLGGTTTFFNVGTAKVLIKQEIKDGDIKNKDGLRLLDLFGIDPIRFAAIFNGDFKQSGKINVSKYDKAGLTHLLMSGIGYGYHVIHKLPSGILSKKIDKSGLKKMAQPKGSLIVEYGGKNGRARRVNVQVTSNEYIFSLNFRDTQGKDGYPNRLMCDFKYRKPKTV